MLAAYPEPAGAWPEARALKMGPPTQDHGCLASGRLSSQWTPDQRKAIALDRVLVDRGVGEKAEPFLVAFRHHDVIALG